MTRKEWDIFQFGKWVGTNNPFPKCSTDTFVLFDMFCKARLKEITADTKES